MKKRIISMLLVCMMILSLMPMAVFAGNTVPDGAVAHVTDAEGHPVDAGEESSGALGGGYYSTLAGAVAVAKSGNTVEIINADTYTVPNLPNNITIKGGVEGVVFNCVGIGSIASVPNGATFEDVSFTFGNNNYHGFQHAGHITMKNCKLDGLLFSYGNMTFEGCSFTQTTKEYNMWLYGKDCTFTNCTFNSVGKFLNVYCESNTETYNITATDCTFNSTKTNKAAFNVKETCGDKALRYNVSISNCTCNENFPAASESNSLIVFNGLVQVDDRKAEKDGITVTLDGTKVYENGKKVSTNFFEKEDGWHIANLAGLKEFAAQTSTLANKTVVLDADIDLGNEAWTPINANGSTDIVFDGNNKTIKNVKVSGNEKNVGLFGDFSCCTIMNLTIDGADVTGINHVAALCGHGLCAKIEGCTVKNAVVTANVYNNDDGDKAGAICGYLSGESVAYVKGCTVENCKITGYRDIGGAVGYANGKAEVSNTSVKNTTVCFDRDNNYKNYTTDAEFDAGAVVGEAVATAVIGSDETANTTENVTVKVLKAGDVTVGEDDETAEVTVEQKSEVVTTGEGVAALEEEVKTAISTNTKVTGVKLTTTSEEGEKSGLQAVVNAAVEKEGSAIAEAIATADTVNIEVKVNVVPTEFKEIKDATETEKEVIGTVTFELKPTATVTVGTGDNAKSETVYVDNSMIDTSKPITVSIYTGFEPVKIVHSGDNGFKEVFRKTGDKTFTYNEKTKVCTLTISHFSKLKAVAKVYVAQTGEERQYETLAEAVSAAQNGDTITVLEDIDNAQGMTINTQKTFTIDFNNHTYTVTAPAAGSSGTKNQAFQLISGQTITMKNGTVKLGAANLTAGSGKISRVIQNYANLKLDNMKFDDENLAWRADSQTAAGTLTSDAMIECDKGTVSLINGTTLTIADANKEKRFALAIEDWNSSYPDGAQVTIDGATVNGHIRFYSDGEIGSDLDSTLTIKTNTINGKIYDAAQGVTGGKITETIEGYSLLKESENVYVVASDVAQIGDKTYTTLAEAVSNAQSGNTITMIADCPVSDTLSINKAVTIDGQGLYKIHPDTPSYFENKSSEQTAASSAVPIVSIKSNDVTLKNLTIQARAFSRHDLAIDGCTATLDNVTLDHQDHSSRGNDSIQLNGGLIVKNNLTIKLGACLRYYDDSGNSVGENGKVIQSWGGISFNSVDSTIQFTEGSSFNGIDVPYTDGTPGHNQAMIHLWHTATHDKTNIDAAFANVSGSIPANLVKVIGSGWSMTGFEIADSAFLKANYPVKIGDVYYQSLAEAVKYVENDETITLLDDVTLASTVEINNGKTFSIDLNGKDIAGNGARALWIMSGNVTLTGKGSISANGNALADGSSVIRVGNNTNDTNTASLTVGENVTVSTEKCYGITAFSGASGGTGAKVTLVVDGTVISKDVPAISGCGNVFNGETDITVNGTVKAENENAIYFPCAGNLVINGTVEGKGGVEMKAGNATVSNVTIGNGATIKATAASTTHVKSNDGCSTSGYALVAVENSGYKGKPSITVNGGKITGHVGIVADDEAETGKKATISITGGYFTTDPTAYLASVYAVAVSDVQGYAYMVAKVDLPAGGNDDIGVVSKQPDVDCGDRIHPDYMATVAATAAKTEVAGLGQDALKEAAKVNADSAKAKLIGASVEVGDDAIVTVFAQTYLDVKPQEYDSGTNKVYTVDITPMVQLIATTAANAEGIKTDDGEGKNAVALGDPTELKVNTPVVVTIPLPAGFAAENDTLYVKHIKDSGAFYLYNCTVQKDASDQLYIQFVNNNGFSTFEITANDTSVASIEKDGSTLYYTSLSAAVAAVKDGETIKLTANCGETVTVARAVSFTLYNNGYDFTGSITPGANYKNTGTGNIYDFTYVAPSGGGGGVASYAVSAASATHGKVTVDKASASEGSTVTITVTPDKGFTLETLTVKDAKGDEVALTAVKTGESYTFKMPAGKVTVSATFMEDNTMLNFFVDVKADDYFYDAVLWAAKNGITSGVDATHFAPMAITTRGQMVTFLWRAAGSPEPTETTCVFTDVKADEYYYKAVLWAAETGLTKGTSDTTFSPDAEVSRGQTVTFLARLNGVKDDATGYSHSFADVKTTDYYNNAVAWAATNKITDGTSAATFSPNDDCLRGQIVTFLYRNFVK